MPKKAVALYLLLALLGAALFVYFTFPRTKDEIPQSNNQRPFPSSPGPNGVPLPENIPRPTVPTTPHGPSLRIMAWATPAEAARLQAEADAYAASAGIQTSLLISSDPTTYRRDLQRALASDAAPDVCLIDSREFSGLDPTRDLVAVTPPSDLSPRSIQAFTVAGSVTAIPDEYSVDMLFYNHEPFDQAGIAYPGRHWTWDIMEAMTRGLASLQLKNPAGRPIYPLELPANFDFWNILCMQAGHAALDGGNWRLADADSRDSQMRGLDLLHEFFHELSVTAPPARDGAPVGRYFAAQRAALLIAPSELAASLPKFDWGMTVLPSDLSRADLARVNGWAVSSRSAQPEQAVALARFLGAEPVHLGWSSVQKPADGSSNENLCYEALEQSLIPRIEPKSERLAELLDRQINSFARGPQETTSKNLYAQIQAEYQAENGPASAEIAARTNRVAPKADVPQLRGL